MGAPLLFFPVEAGPLTMKAGLVKFPQSAGEPFLLEDDDGPRYRAVKRDEHPEVRARRAVRRVETDEEARAESAALEFLAERVAQEAPAAREVLEHDRPRWDALGRALQEDYAILHRGSDGAGRALVLHVSGPSGWRPETLARADFAAIHGPVPGFPGKASDTPQRRDAASKSMVASMIERGPYVRFVWTISADDALDHHPASGLRARWPGDPQRYFFRVERQITVPFPSVGGSLFLIRTFIYPFSRLHPDQRNTLAAALRAMPAELAAYKGLSDAVGPATAALVGSVAPGQGERA